MTLVQLGALGEFIGAIAVVITLVYIAIQVRQNTQSLEEAKRVALAQTYQMRADALQDMMVAAADSEHIAPIIQKLTEAGYPEDIRGIDRLEPIERGRLRLWQIAQQTHWDNMFYQYQSGFIDRDYYESSLKERVRRLAPTWKVLRIGGNRGEFNEEIERLLAEDRTGHPF